MNRAEGDQFVDGAGETTVPGRLIGAGAFSALKHLLFLDAIDLDEAQIRIGFLAHLERAAADKIRKGVIQEAALVIDDPRIAADPGADVLEQGRQKLDQVDPEEEEMFVALPHGGYHGHGDTGSDHLGTCHPDLTRFRQLLHFRGDRRRR